MGRVRPLPAGEVDHLGPCRPEPHVATPTATCGPEASESKIHRGFAIVDVIQGLLEPASHSCLRVSGDHSFVLHLLTTYYVPRHVKRKRRRIVGLAAPSLPWAWRKLSRAG